MARLGSEIAHTRGARAKIDSRAPETLDHMDQSTLRRVFKAFQYRDFRLLWFGACTSSIGTWMQEVAQSWVVLQISGSAFWLGFDAFLGDIPIFLFSLIGGVIADRMSRRRLLTLSQ